MYIDPLICMITSDQGRNISVEVSDQLNFPLIKIRSSCNKNYELTSLFVFKLIRRYFAKTNDKSRHCVFDDHAELKGCVSKIEMFAFETESVLNKNQNKQF